MNSFLPLNSLLNAGFAISAPNPGVLDTLRQMFSQSIPQVINSSMTILVTFLGMLFTNALLTVVVLVCVFFALLVTRFLAGRSSRYFLRQQGTLGALNGYIEEMINGQKVVKVFCHEEEAQELSLIHI